MRPHRIFAAVVTALALTLAFGTTDARAAYNDKEGYDPSLGLARISYMTGDVLYYAPDTDEWAAAAPNFALREQDSLWVGDDSKAEVRFSAGETAWMNYQTGLDILHMQDDKNGQTYQVGLPSGEASFYVRNFDTLGSVFQVDTPSASVRAYGKAYFRVNSLDDGTTQVGVHEGSVEVESDYGVLTLRPGDLIEVYPNGRPRVMALPGSDSWDDWVEARLNRYTKKYASDRYLPSNMDSYAYEFDEYGTWRNSPDYGYVWVPRVSVGWSPYSYGRWVYSGYDYVWLPYDPWYAPYHYGRWYWDLSFGWYWIPPTVGFTYWSPGYVGWCYGPDYLYWVPLGPGEIYYGYGYYGPRSVNIYIHKDVHIKNVYINSRVRNAVVAVDRHDFREGRDRRTRITENDNPFRRKIRDVRVTGHAPVHEIKPDRQLRFPKPDVRVTERSKPPRKVMERVKIVKERRLVTNTRGSAFEQGRRPERMKDVEETGRTPRWKNQEEKKRAVERTFEQGRGRAVERTGEKPVERGRGKAVEQGREKAPQETGAGGRQEGAARPGRWEQLREERPGAAERGKTRTEEKAGAPAGREGVQRGATPQTETGTGRQGERLYRETGSDRGSLRRDEGKSRREGAVSEPAGTRVDESGKTGAAPGRRVRSAPAEKGTVEKLQPPVREGAGGDNGGEAVEKGRPASKVRGATKERPANAKERGASKKRAKPGASDESGDETEPAAEEQPESPGRGLGRDRQGR